VHSHNLKLVDYYRDPSFGADVRPVDYVPEEQRATFQGFVRAGGGVGTRNFIGILSSVNCSATVIKRIAAHFTPERLAAFPNVDGVAAFAQSSGCGMSSPSEHFDVLRRTLAGYARHPNLAGVLIVGLGCERNQVDALVDSQGLKEGQLLRTLVMQEVGGTRATIEAGIAAIEEMLPIANQAQRSTVSAATSRSAWNAAARTAFRASRPTPAWARPWTFWCATAARPFCPRRPRSTAWSSCSRAAPSVPKSARSCWTAWPGGNATQPARTPSSTAWSAMATRPAAWPTSLKNPWAAP
jgi:altronate hydrolase